MSTDEPDGLSQTIETSWWTSLSLAASNIVEWVISVEWLSWFSKLVELLIGVSWPLALLAALVMFRKQLNELIDRVVRVGKEGIDFAQPQKPPSSAELSPAGTLSLADTVPLDFRPLVEEIEVRVDSAIPQIMESRNVDRLEALRMGAIDAWGSLLVERVYRPVFGSQIEAIEFLKSEGGSASIEALRPFFDRGAKNEPKIYVAYRFEQWVDFLRLAELIRIEGTTASVTALGRALLPYIERHGYIRDKAG